MKKLSIWHWLIAIALSAFTIFLACGMLLAIFQKGVGSAEAAAWVQAIGAIAAIGVAIWVSYRQHEKELARDEEREADEVQNLLYSIRDELEVLVAQFQAIVGKRIAESVPETPLLTKWVPPESPFLIYMSAAGKIGKVNDHELRRLIVVTYSHANNLFVTFRIHNEFLDKALVVNRRGITGKFEDHTFSKLAIDDLKNSSDALRDRHREFMTSVEQLLAKLPVPQHRVISP